MTADQIPGSKEVAGKLTRKRTKPKSALRWPKPRRSKIPSKVSHPSGISAIPFSSRYAHNFLLSSSGRSPARSTLHYYVQQPIEQGGHLTYMQDCLRWLRMCTKAKKGHTSSMSPIPSTVQSIFLLQEYPDGICIAPEMAAVLHFRCHKQ